MRATVLFSIIVPVYRVEDCLDRCVRSLLGQNYQNIEIILVDDGSPDRCPVLCDEYAKQDERIRVIHKENGGPSEARNAGLRAARGEYILFVDSDDYIEQDTCERLVPFARTGCDIIVVDGVTEGGVKHLTHGNVVSGFICSGREYLKTACKRNAMLMAVWLYVYRKEFLEENEFWFRKGIIHEDEQFIPRTFLAAQRVTESGLRSYHYVIREGSIMTQTNQRKNAEDMYTVCLELQKMYKDIQDHELRDLLIDSLVVKYLSLFQQGKLYQYGRDYIHKDFVWKNARRRKTKCKALLFCISSKLYWHINHSTKRVKQRQTGSGSSRDE